MCLSSDEEKARAPVVPTFRQVTFPTGQPAMPALRATATPSSIPGASGRVQRDLHGARGEPESRALGFPRSGLASLSLGSDELLIQQFREKEPNVLARVPLGGGAPRPIAEGVLDAIGDRKGTRSR